LFRPELPAVKARASEHHKSDSPLSGPVPPPLGGAERGSKRRPVRRPSAGPASERLFIFTALPGGYRNNDGTFNNIGNNGNWWSATAYDATNSWNRNMNYDNENVNRNNNNARNGFSVRIVRDLYGTSGGPACCWAGPLPLLRG